MRHTFTHLEAGDRRAGTRHDGLLACDHREVFRGDRRLLGIAGRFADAHIDDHLVETRDHHFVGVVELFLERLADRLVVELLEPGLILGVSH
jgi:hypothetical protein